MSTVYHCIYHDNMYHNRNPFFRVLPTKIFYGQLHNKIYNLAGSYVYR